MRLAASKQYIGVNTEFLDDVISGLSQRQKTLPCKYFYDERGSQLFEQICATREYYVTRTEISIYQEYGMAMATTIGERALLLEPGAGSTKKIALLLRCLQKPTGFIPMDISAEILQASAAVLEQQFPDLDITPLVVDFLDKQPLQQLLRQLPQQPLAAKRVVFFPGSTIGNFDPASAENFLQQFAEALEPGDGLLIGVDLLKDKSVLEAAYNDQQGVTVAFNTNLLHRINQELGGDFAIDQFEHRAQFNEHKSRIEMHLVSRLPQQVTIGDDSFDFAANETIHTENSYKYSPQQFIERVTSAGYTFEQQWQDKHSLFGVFYFSVV